MNKAVIILGGVILFLVGIGLFIVYNIRPGVMDDNSSIVTPGYNVDTEVTDWAVAQGEFEMNLPCGVIDFDSPYVTPVKCTAEKMQKGSAVGVKFKGRITDESGEALESVKITANNGDIFYTDKFGFFDSKILVDSNRKAINFLADKMGYSPLRKVFNATAENIETSSAGIVPDTFTTVDMMMRSVDVQKIILNRGKEIKVVSSEYPNVSATIPVDGLVDKDGNIVTGEITGEITYLNPENPDDLKFVPGFNGSMVGVNRQGKQVTLKSGGMVFFHFKREGSDEILQPRKDVTITITQPLLDERYNYYSAMIENSPKKNKANSSTEFKWYNSAKEFGNFVVSEQAVFNYWYFNQRIGLWEEWPVEEFKVDLKNKLDIMKVTRLY